MLVMKTAIYAVSFVFFFLAAACTSEPRQSAGMQFANAFAALRRAWRPALLLSLLTLGVEALAVAFSTGLPAPMGLALAVTLSIASLLVWLPLNLALTWLLYQRVSR